MYKYDHDRWLYKMIQLSIEEGHSILYAIWFGMKIETKIEFEDTQKGKSVLLQKKIPLLKVNEKRWLFCIATEYKTIK